MTRGAGVTVAVVDTGVDAHHPDLAGRVLAGADFTGRAANGQVDVSADSHGTSVAGVIASTGRAGQAVFGLAPEAQIMPIRVSDGAAIAPVALAQGILYAVNHGCQVINISLGSPVPDPEIRAAVTFALDHDVVVVAAAGNDHGAGNPAEYPAAFPGVVAVSGTDQAGRFWPRSESGPWITLAAPAESIYSTSDKGGYLTASGTSYAAPYVAAAAALIRARYPTETAGQVITRLVDTAQRPTSQRQRDDHLGHGIVDPYRALTAPTPTTTTNPLRTTAIEPRTRAPGRDRSTGGVVFWAGLLAIGAAIAATGASAALFTTRHRRKTS
jgi:Subtilisin-like serine proteases